jgi:hypothetical protein
MRYIRNGIYSQVFYSHDLMGLIYVVNEERSRLEEEFDILVLKDVWKMNDNNDKDIRYTIEIFFIQVENKPVNSKQLFGKYYDR